MKIALIILIIVCIVSLFYFILSQSKKKTITQLNKEIENLEENIKRYKENCEDTYNQSEYFKEQLYKNALLLDKSSQDLNKLNIEVANRKNSIEREVLLAQTNADQKKEYINNEIINLQAQKEKVKEELEDFRVRRQALNKILQEEEKKRSEKEPHSIWISEESKKDIDYLLSILPNISQKEILLKLIWSSYIQKPLNEMLHRICGSSNPKNVVYMIKNLESGKIYIGKTTDYLERMKQHIKSSLQIGTISHQRIHDALFRNWDKFYFDIIESDIKNLTEREKYYIRMFESDIYGYNMKG